MDSMLMPALESAFVTLASSPGLSGRAGLRLHLFPELHLGRFKGAACALFIVGDYLV